ncbi:hypothetical protein AAHC03_016710 [Spirometra sp. Aus1]
MPLFIGSYETTEIGRKTKTAGFSCDRLASRPEEAGAGEFTDESQIHPKLDINSHYRLQMPRKSLPRTPLFMQPPTPPDASNGNSEQSKPSSVDDTQHESEGDILPQQICETQNKPSQAAPPDNLAAGSELLNDDLVQMKALQEPQITQQIGDEPLPAKRSDLTEAEDDVFIQNEPPQVYESVTVVQPTRAEAPVVTTTEPPKVHGTSKELIETQPEALEAPSLEQPLRQTTLPNCSDEVPSVEPSDLMKPDEEILVKTEPPLVYESVTSVQSRDQKTENVTVVEPPQVHEPTSERAKTQPETPEFPTLEQPPHPDSLCQYADEVPSEELTDLKKSDEVLVQAEQPPYPDSPCQRAGEVPPEKLIDLKKSDDEVLVQTEVALNQDAAKITSKVDENTESPQETNKEVCEAGPQQMKSKNFEVTQEASLTAGTLESDSLCAIHEEPSSDIQVNPKPTNIARLEPVSPLDEIRKLKQDFQNIKNVTSVLQNLLSSIADKDADSRTAEDIKKIHDLAESLPQMKTQLEANIEQYKTYVEQKKAMNEKPAFTVENMLNELTEALNDLQNVQKDYMEFNQHVNPTAPSRKKSWNLFGRRQDRV